MSEAKDDVFYSEVSTRLLENNQDSENEFWEVPGILESIRTGDLLLSKILTKDERSEMEELIFGVIGLLVRRHFGDEIAYQQLNVVHSFMFPKQYEVPEHVLERLSKRYRSGHLTRVWALRRLMYKLSDLVAPTLLDTENLLVSPVRLLPQADSKHPLYSLVKKYLKRGTTLQILAIRIYLEMQSARDEDSTIDERTLKRDLQRLREWEETDAEHAAEKGACCCRDSSVLEGTHPYPQIFGVLVPFPAG